MGFRPLLLMMRGSIDLFRILCKYIALVAMIFPTRYPPILSAVHLSLISMGEDMLLRP